MSIGVAAAFKGIEHRAVDHVIAMKDLGWTSCPTVRCRFVFTRLLTENLEGIQQWGTDVPMPWQSERGDVEWSNPVARRVGCACVRRGSPTSGSTPRS
jgi:hypothetical protein